MTLSQRKQDWVVFLCILLVLGMLQCREAAAHMTDPPEICNGASGSPLERVIVGPGGDSLALAIIPPGGGPPYQATIEPGTEIRFLNMDLSTPDLTIPERYNPTPLILTYE